MNGDAVGAGHVVGDDPHFAVRRARTHPLAHHFGRIQSSFGIESEIVGTDDRSTDRAYDRHLARARINGAYLAAEGLGDVEAAVGTEAHAVGAVERAGR